MLEWGGDDPFTHLLVVGPTRCGKTATVLKQLVYQILNAKRQGIQVGLSVVEPKGDLAAMVKEASDEMGVDCVHIDPSNPNSHRINVMEGDKNDIAEATVAVLKSMFGKQEAFFQTVQELSSRKVTLLLKELFGNKMDIMDVVTNLREEEVLKKNVNRLKQLKGDTDLVKFFEYELFGKNSLSDKYRQLVIGLRAQMENITSNEYLKRIITGKSSINIDDHFERGGVLAVNTALGLLGKAGDAFGQFVAMHLQLGTFRRKGTEKTRIPHYLIFDEYSRYINPDVERFLSIAAEYRVAGIFAIQSLAQLEVEAGTISAKAMKQAIKTSTRNKIIFGGLSYDDAKEISNELGQEKIRERSRTYDGNFFKRFLPKHYKVEERERERFSPTVLMDGLPRFHYIYKLVQEGHPQPPGIAKGEFIPRNWKELLMEEEKESTKEETNEKKVNKIIKKFAEKQRDKHKEKAKKREKEKFKELLGENPFKDSETSSKQISEESNEINKMSQNTDLGYNNETDNVRKQTLVYIPKKKHLDLDSNSNEFTTKTKEEKNLIEQNSQKRASKNEQKQEKLNNKQPKTQNSQSQNEKISEDKVDKQLKGKVNQEQQEDFW